MIVVLMAGLTAGITALVIADTQVRALDGTRTQAFYVTHAGLEKLTADLGDLFSVNFAPTAAQINALTTAPPSLGAIWQQPDGTNGYRVTFPADGSGNPQASTMTVMSGPFQGLIGLATPYQVNVTARLADGSEANLTRTLQTVAIPVFQFGYFSENDLSFFAGPNFNFGGRVHSNATLYFASGDGSTLTLADRVTAVGEIVRTNLSNGWSTIEQLRGHGPRDSRARASTAVWRAPRAAWSARSAAPSTSRPGRTSRPARTTTTSRTAARAPSGSICRSRHSARRRSI